MDDKIELRMWDTEEKQFMSHSRVLESRVSDIEKNGQERFIFQQYTGLNDKDGRKIYAGDIVKHEDFSIGCTIDLNITGVVKMVDGSWCVERGDNGDYLFTETGTNEVIGSIFENPELLEV
ncbi:YopX family protein [Paenibacillus sp. P46E]|uniref:YopX family protein n=1 Tax=Paenibacillus sp. P46E TaxID=1349436 RepID=UPI000939F7C9|nr:YopX family protein [Paenibacillus sp. P46E]OKP95076.1 hypothetical protein A3849_27735 [Paenibacillus sp. P46E]